VEDVQRRYRVVREAMERDGLDAVIVSGSEYTGFEGSVIDEPGVAIVHRYAYVLSPARGRPTIVFPREATYWRARTTWIEENVFVDRPGEWLADRVRQRVGVYGFDYAMTVRLPSLAGAAELVNWEVAFDHARAVKSDYELSR
jgi:Xaa-Pro aminopeptidase